MLELPPANPTVWSGSGDRTTSGNLLMSYSKFYAVLSQKANLVLWLIFITVFSLGLGTLILGGEFAMQLEPFKIEVKQQK